MESFQNIKKKSQQIVSDLLNLGNQSCVNIISNNIYYIISLVKKKDQQASLSEEKIRRYQAFVNGKLLYIDGVVSEIVKRQSDIIWVDFILYFSLEKETIILVELIFGKNNTELSFHACIYTPQESIINNCKFDLNWHLGGVNNK
jgi:negative regulator of sigma E activity